LNNLEERQSSKTIQPAKLNSEETDNLNRWITSSEIKFLMKKENNSVNKIHGPDGFTGGSYQK